MRSLQPGKRAARRAWRNEPSEILLPLLWEGQREQALAHLRRLRPSQGDVPPAFENAVHSLETQRDWMGDDQAWEESGYPVGSGLVERAVAVVIKTRMNKRGMRWKRANATAVVALLVQRMNAAWESTAASPPIGGGTCATGAIDSWRSIFYTVQNRQQKGDTSKKMGGNAQK